MIFTSYFWTKRAGVCRSMSEQSAQVQHVAAPKSRRYTMIWETPAYCEIRLGFEVTAYVYTR